MGLPPLELPSDALVLFESVPAGSTRAGAFRFVVTHDGRFLHSGNDDAGGGPAAPYWTTELEHLKTFDAPTVRAVSEAAEEVRRLPETIRNPPGNESHPTIERITVATTGDERPHSTITNARTRPQQVTKLLEIVERAGQAQG